MRNPLAHRIIAVLSIVLFVIALLFNAYLLYSIVDGAQVVREAEMRAGHTLSCFELNDASSIETYFYPDRALQGDTIYLSGILFPFWLGLSIGLPITLLVVLGKPKRWQWLPLALMALLMIAIIFQSGMLNKLVCALE